MILSGSPRRLSNMPKLLPSSPATMQRLVKTGIVVYVLVLASAIYLICPRVVTQKEPGWTGSTHAPQTVVSVDPGGPATGRLQRGDRIVAIDHDARFGEAYLPTKKLRTILPGATYHVDVLRQGKQVGVDLVLNGKHTTQRLTIVVLYLICSAAFFTCGVIMGWLKPENKTARLGWLACSLTGFCYIHFAFEYFPFWSVPLLVRLVSLAYPWHLFAAYCFVASLGASQPETRVWRNIRRVLFVITALAWLRNMANEDWPWTQLVRVTWPLWVWDAWFWIQTARLVLVILGIFAVLIRNYRNSAGPRDRRSIEIVAGTIALGVGSTGIAAISADLLGTKGAIAALQIANLVPLLIPIGFCYAVVAHRVLDIRLIFRKGLQYLLARQVLRILFLLPLLLIVTTALRHPDAPIRSMVNVTGLVLVISIAVCLEFRDAIQGAVDRWFFRERFDRERLLRELLTEIAAAGTARQICSLVQIRLKSLYSPAFVSVTEEASLCEDRLHPDAIVFPLSGLDGKRLGCLMIGARLADLPYTAEDRELLQLVAAQTGLMFDVLQSSRQASDVGQAILAERSRIAMELHDTAGQGFTGISLYLRAAEKVIQGSPEQASVFLNAARELASTSAKEARESLRGIRSTRVSAGGTHLEFRLRRLASTGLGDSEIGPTVTLESDPCAFDFASADIGWHLARIAEEAVTNARKHARATSILLRLTRSGTSLELTIQDDGVGFDGSALEGTKAEVDGMGLHGMQERLRQLNGTMVLKSKPGQGTRIHAIVPLAEVSREVLV